jgi:hypothetical protein
MNIVMDKYCEHDIYIYIFKMMYIITAMMKNIVMEKYSEPDRWI